MHRLTHESRPPAGAIGATALLLVTLMACAAAPQEAAPPGVASGPLEASTQATARAVRTPHPTPAPTPSPSVEAAEPPSLAHIAFGTDRPDVNMKISERAIGTDALEGLVPPGARAVADVGLADAVAFSFAGPLDAANPRASYAHFVTYALRYATELEATAAFDAITRGLSDTGEWQASETGAGLGVQNWAATRDGDAGRDIGYVWRRSDLVLAIFGLRDSDRAAVRDTARRMDERAS